MTDYDQRTLAGFIFTGLCALTVGWLMWERQPAPAPLALPVPGTVTGKSPTSFVAFSRLDTSRPPVSLHGNSFSFSHFRRTLTLGRCRSCGPRQWG
jgi:hypothetical protein